MVYSKHPLFYNQIITETWVDRDPITGDMIYSKKPSKLLPGAQFLLPNDMVVYVCNSIVLAHAGYKGPKYFLMRQDGCQYYEGVGWAQAKDVRKPGRYFDSPIELLREIPAARAAFKSEYLEEIEEELKFANENFPVAMLKTGTSSIVWEDNGPGVA